MLLHRIQTKKWGLLALLLTASFAGQRALASAEMQDDEDMQDPMELVDDRAELLSKLANAGVGDKITFQRVSFPVQDSLMPPPLMRGISTYGYVNLGPQEGATYEVIKVRIGFDAKGETGMRIMATNPPATLKVKRVSPPLRKSETHFWFININEGTIGQEEDGASIAHLDEITIIKKS